MYVLLLIKLQPKNSRFSILFRLFFKRENAKQNFIEQNQLSMENNPTVATFYYGRGFFIETSYHKTNHKQDFWETFVTGKSIVLHFLLGFVWPRALLPLYSFWLQKNLHTLILNTNFWPKIQLNFLNFRAEIKFQNIHGSNFAHKMQSKKSCDYS